MRRTVVAALLAGAIATPLDASALPQVHVVAYNKGDTADPLAENSYGFLPGGDEWAGTPLSAVTVDAGETVTLANLGRTEHHSITSFKKILGQPVFNSGLVSPNTTKEVAGVPTLAVGTYRFYCLKHQYQQGTLVVQ